MPEGRGKREERGERNVGEEREWKLGCRLTDAARAAAAPPAGAVPLLRAGVVQRLGAARSPLRALSLQCRAQNQEAL